MNTLKETNRCENPCKEFNFLSNFFHCYMNPIYAKGCKEKLTPNDIFKINKNSSYENIRIKLNKYWKEEKEKCLYGNKKASFVKVCIQVIKYEWFICLMLFIIFQISTMLQSYFLKECLDALSSKSTNESFYWSLGLIAAIIIQYFLIHPTFYYLEILGVNMKSALFNLIYKKMLSIKSNDLQRISDGHVITMLSYDGNTIEEGIRFSSFIIGSPIVTTICIWLLWNVVGSSSLVGVGVTFLLLIIQFWFGRWFGKIKKRAIKLTDVRINKMNEIVAAMQLTKMYAWEESFSQHVNNARKEEAHQVKTSVIIRAINSALSTSIPVVAMFSTFTTYYFAGNEITIGKVYFALSVFFILRMVVTYMTLVAVPLGMASYVSCKRIEKFMLMEEIQRINSNTGNEKETSSFIEFDKVVATFDKQDDENSSTDILKGISFKVDAKSSPLIIYGTVGSGKTSIIMTVLNELVVKSGKVNVRGTLSYSSQQPWIFSETIRQNILFGQKYNEDRFNMVLEVCALQQDLDSLKKREYTMVGEKGISLSGGQKARISLARAVYKDADIYLLDDPLSAVDSKVGKFIFERCIKGLLQSKVVVLVTHQTRFLTEAAQTLHLKLKAETSENYINNASIGISNNNETITTDSNDRDQSNTYVEKCKKDSTVVEKIDEMSDNRIKSLKLYMNYFVDGIGYLSTFILFTSLIITQVLITFTNYWIGEWASVQENKELNKTQKALLVYEKNSDKNIHLFAGLTSMVLFTVAFSSIFLFLSLINSACVLHNAMFARVMKAHLQFFTINPIGQILNRFSGDMHYMDNELPWVMSDFLKLVLESLAIVIINCINVPYLTPFAAVIVFFLVKFRNYHMLTSKQIKSMEAADRSPMYTHASATLAGLATIRAFGLQEKVNNEFIKCVDHQAESRLMFYRSNRWFALRLDAGVVMFSIACILAPVIIAISYDINVELVGVSFTYLLSMCGMFQWCVRQSAELDNLMTSVERVYEYTNLEIEEDPCNELYKKGNGEICSINASFAYHPSLPNSLHDISFSIASKEKIGIVGRTGAGKSSLFKMLLRLGKNSGNIFIDGNDISKLSLKSLRSITSVIPQDPVMFLGSVRHNLDPFGVYDDEEIWTSLEEVQMKEKVMSFKGKLDGEVSGSGSNLSVGERQLFCMARAILRKSKILLVDEATANTDQRTDELIQKMIRTKFKDCTVLTIAHRVNTIMNSDKIMVIHNGRIVEFDKTDNLLRIRNGYFRELVEQSGRMSIPANKNE